MANIHVRMDLEGAYTSTAKAKRGGLADLKFALSAIPQGKAFTLNQVGYQAASLCF